MKDLHTTPNEHLEARITAWVLGQASPFEAAELEAICAADPELQLFLNRTKALHSLLLETPPSASDQFWKLSPEKREKLDPIIGSNNSASPTRDSGTRRAAYRAAFGIAAVLTVTLFIKRFVFTSLSSDKEASNIVVYESATDEVRFSRQAKNEVFFDETASDDQSNSIAASSPRKPSAPSASAPAPASERDTTLALLDSKFKTDSKARDFDGDRQSGNKAPRSRIQAQESDMELAKKSSKSNEIAAKGNSPVFPTTPGTPPAPSAAPAELTLNDGGIDLAGGGGGGKSDMSNTFLAAEAIAASDKAIASNSASSQAIPVPKVKLSEPSVELGDGKDFGNGWGSSKDAESDALAANDSNGKGGFRYEPGARKKESASSQGALSAEGLAAMKEKRVDANTSITQEPGSSFAGTYQSFENGAIAGNRSGDDAVERNSIDEILSNPDRSLAAGESAARGPSANKDSIHNAPSMLKGKEGDTQLGVSRPLSPEHAEQVDQVRRELYKAQGNFDLGKYNDAKKSYEDILRVDPYNQAARRGMEKVAETKSEYYRAAYDETRSELLAQVDKASELAVPAEAKMNDDPLSATSQGDLANLREGAMKKDLSALLEADVADHQKNNSAPADFAGFMNYGSPVQGEPKQIDITTKFVEGAQGNDQSRFRSWLLADTDKRDELDLYSPADSAQAIEFQSLATGFTGEGEVPMWGDIPITGKLFQEDKPGNTEYEIHAGYKSEYLFRGEVITEPKKPSLTDLSNELSAAEEAFSTFSLNISDASFQLALAAIEKGERPDPASIKPEQFYNGVDYGDPAPSASEPVAAAIDQTAHPVIPGRNLVRVALRTGSTGRSAAQPLRLTLLVDQSGSMVRADRRVAMETALAQLATLLTEHDQVTVIGFSRTPHLLAQSLPGNQAAKLPELINQTASEGGTNLEQAINLATEQALGQQLAGAQNRIVLFTDGAANLGDADPDRLSEKIKNIRQQGLAFDIAGIGTNDVNDKLLSDLARHGNGRYYLVGEKTAGNLATQLAGAFRPAAENVKVQVKLNPQRVGNYKLIGFEKDRLKTEDFRNDAVDAAELAADEAGVALYQVETLPEGTGEIGEVSVRFRDTATGEMVERTWTIPYDASAPSFDKANPKTQLATLALLAAQKLQTGPMADAIDFSKHSETIAKLKQANAKSAKTQQLINLINAIK